MAQTAAMVPKLIRQRVAEFNGPEPRANTIVERHHDGAGQHRQQGLAGQKRQAAGEGGGERQPESAQPEGD